MACLDMHRCKRLPTKHVDAKVHITHTYLHVVQAMEVQPKARGFCLHAIAPQPVCETVKQSFMTSSEPCPDMLESSRHMVAFQ